LVLEGHTAAVTSAAISPDGRRAVTGSQDGTAKLWDLSTGTEVLSLKRHAAEITSVHFSPDGRNILTSSLDESALAWPSVNIGPSIKLSRTMAPIQPGSEFQPVDPAGLVLDPDSPDFSTGKLTVELIASENEGYSLSIATDSPSIRRDGDQIIWTSPSGTGQIIASLNAMNAMPPRLDFDLGPAATAATMQDLIRALVWTSQAPARGKVTIRLSLTDGDGGQGNLATIEFMPPAAQNDVNLVHQSN
jgi:WD40 repeat protein